MNCLIQEQAHSLYSKQTTLITGKMAVLHCQYFACYFIPGKLFSFLVTSSIGSSDGYQMAIRHWISRLWHCVVWWYSGGEWQLTVRELQLQLTVRELQLNGCHLIEKQLRLKSVRWLSVPFSSRDCIIHVNGVQTSVLVNVFVTVLHVHSKPPLAQRLVGTAYSAYVTVCR